MKKLVLLVMVAISLVDCTRRTSILIDGSSTVYPITEAMAEEYSKLNPKVSINVGVSGTGGGFKKFCTGEIKLVDASREIKSSEVELCAKNKIDYVPFMIGYDGLAVIANTKNTSIDSLTVEQLKLIFNSEKPAKTFKEVSPKFSSDTIKIFSPGQDSGTYDYFVEAILGKKATMRSDATFSEDDNVLVTGVSGYIGSIGYFGLAYYENNKASLKLIPIINPTTKQAVLPTADTVKSGEYAPLSRPLFIYVNKSFVTSSKGEQLKNFAEFYLNNINKFVASTGYIPLSDDAIATEKNKLQSLF